MGNRHTLQSVESSARQPEYSYHTLITIWMDVQIKDNGNSTWFLCCSGEGYLSLLAHVNMVGAKKS